MNKSKNVKQQQVQGEPADRLYYVKEHIIETNRSTMVLTHPKGEFDRIIFDHRQDERLERVLVTCFENGKEFDFRVSKNLGNGCCKIDKIIRAY